MRILKFGGTSVGSPENIKKTIAIIQKTQQKHDLAVVVSAFTKITDHLIHTATLAAKGDPGYKDQLNEIKKRHLEAVQELISGKRFAEVQKNVEKTLEELENLLQGIALIKEISLRTMDLVMSFGERLSAYIISEAMDAKFLDAREIVRTDENFSYAKVNFPETNKNIQEFFQKNPGLYIITGFIGSTADNETTTLGRGGSDYSASIFGAALDADEVEIWTDVDGIMTADPRKVKKAFSLKQISYIEAMEMSHFGAKVIHPPTMQPAMQKGIPISIRNTFNPDFPGSMIGTKSDSTKLPIKGISSISAISLLRLQGSGMIGVPGVSKRLFGALSQQKISVILITQASSEHSICFAIDPKVSEKAKAAIEEEFEFEIRAKQIDPIVIEKDLSIIAVVGENMHNTPGMAGKLFRALGKNGINIAAIAQGSSELNISTVIKQVDEIKALNAIHDAFFLSGNKTLHLFMIGAGQIGSTLINQIREQADFLSQNHSLEFKLAGIGNSKKMHFNENGIDLKDWQKSLENGEQMDHKLFAKKIIDLNLPNSIFIDCTASEQVPEIYPEILSQSISIVTPNKKANSGSCKNYKDLKTAAREANVKFLYETNVGAGLPVISTLNDLLISGDKIIKIEAVLSGTLSYIFNTFGGAKSFSETVLEAKNKGYTEPDPRDDLNGLDVGRKLLILARESGLEAEMEEIKIENLIPENCRQVSNIEEFFKKLKENDPQFNEIQAKAAKANQKLRYIGTIENGKAQVSLQSVDQNHPFYSLSGSDNIISFTTNRYKDRPLVVKGPGAGAEVTAAGVFADILRIGNYLT